MQVIEKHKIVFLGDESVGKTSIIERFIFDNFNQEYSPSIGVDFIQKSIKVMNKPVKLQLWDAAGQIRYRSLIPSYIRDSKAAIVCYDITNEKSFQNIPQWIQLIYEDRGEILIYIIGNKSDLQQSRKVDSKQASLMALSLNARYFETSAKQGQDDINDVFLQIATDLNDKKIEIQLQYTAKLFLLRYGRNQINTFVD